MVYLVLLMSAEADPTCNKYLFGLKAVGLALANGIMVLNYYYEN